MNFRFFLALNFLFFHNLTLFGQIGIDSVSRPGVYYPMVEAFEYHSISEGDIVFLGNSITFWADWPLLLEDFNVKNRGIPGDNTFGVRERLYEVIQGKPNKVFILIGINDLARNIPDQVILRNYQGIIRQIQNGSPETNIFFQTLLPTNPDFGKLTEHYHKDESIHFINDRLKELGEKYGITIIDLYSHFADQDGKLLSNYTWDGVHLTIDGYLRWVEILIEEGYL